MTSGEFNGLVIFYLLCGCLIIGILWHQLDAQQYVAKASPLDLALYLLAAVLLLAVWPGVVLYFSTTGRKR